MFNGGRWARYHQTKLANAAFVAALGSKLEVCYYFVSFVFALTCFDGVLMVL
jgi:hypothetical protein